LGGKVPALRQTKMIKGRSDDLVQEDKAVLLKKPPRDWTQNLKAQAR
jgi:hypothetical protein